MDHIQLPLYPPDAYEMDGVRIKGDFILCPTLHHAMVSLRQLQQHYAPRNIIYAFDTVSPSHDDLVLGMAFFLLGGKTQPCALNDSRFIDLII